MTRNPVIGFQADKHGTGGHFILADGTHRLCGSALTEEVLRDIRLAADDSKYRSRDIRHLCMVIKAALVEGVMLRLDRMRRWAVAWARGLKR